MMGGGQEELLLAFKTIEAAVETARQIAASGEPTGDTETYKPPQNEPFGAAEPDSWTPSVKEGANESEEQTALTDTWMDNSEFGESEPAAAPEPDLSAVTNVSEEQPAEALSESDVEVGEEQKLEASVESGDDNLLPEDLAPIGGMGADEKEAPPESNIDASLVTGVDEGTEPEGGDDGSAEETEVNDEINKMLGDKMLGDNPGSVSGEQVDGF